MSVSTKKIQSIVIVGGGTAGWMTAAALSQHFQNMPVEITLVESSQLGTIGVGEATIPTLRRFYRKLGLSDIDVIRATNATCKLGIEFQDWHSKGSSFIHPFGLFGQPSNNTPFHHYWLKSRQMGDNTELEDYSLGINLAKHNKFCLPAPKPDSPLMIFDWALHFDAGLFAALMKKCATDNQITAIDAKITDVQLDSDSGDIQSLKLDNGQTLQGDLFIDCSGFKGLLIEQSLQTGFEDWSQWLVCDRAVAVQSESVNDPIPRTISKAHRAGWQWRIPLQTRTGNGHVFCSQYISTDEATRTLLDNVEGKTLHEPRSFSFTPGRRKLAWNKNCIAVGLASGFLEPLESTSIALVETAIDKIILSFDSPEYNQQKIDRFNEVTQLEYERVRDFIILHYKANQRTDSPMWQYCREMEVPDKLAEKMRLFKSKGDIIRYPWEIFGADSWLAIFSGLGYLPDHYDPAVDNMPLDYMQNSLNQMRDHIKRTVDAVPEHVEFLRRFAGYKKPTTMDS
ncbi:tryptophan halogenase family protein [Neptunicella sp. SCSIO 80796]|uniref:tryptophan halogenase family protein n=1 Tax=Neptunicella plasticusilytica TaxID=3117012 RepID=UPI003A4DE676